MSGFPGCVCDGQGRSLDPTIPDLAQDQLDACPHCSLVTDRDAAPIVRVWLLTNNAMPDAIPRVLMIEAVKLILAQRREPEVDVREGLLDTLDLTGDLVRRRGAYDDERRRASAAATGSG